MAMSPIGLAAAPRTGAPRGLGAMAPQAPNIANNVTGALASPVAGRTDHLPISAPTGSYVIPADVVSALGEGNTNSGFSILQRMFPHSTQASGAPSPTGKIDIMAAGGEFIVSPQDVAAIGGGDVKAGHAMLDKFVKDKRAQYKATLARMPGPAR